MATVLLGRAGTRTRRLKSEVRFRKTIGHDGAGMRMATAGIVAGLLGLVIGVLALI